MRSIILLVVVLNLLIGNTWAKANTCKEIPKSKPVDPAFTKKLNTDGRFVAIHKKIQGFGPKEPPSQDDVPKMEDDGDTAKKEMCYDIDMKTPYGEIDYPVKCKYGEKIKCGPRASTPNVPAAPVPIPTGGFLPNIDVVVGMTKTDNATYKVHVGCLGRVEPFFIVIAASSDLKQSAKEDILSHLAKLGFKDGDASSESDPVVIREFKISDCENDPTGNPTSAVATGLSMFQKAAKGPGGSKPKKSSTADESENNKEEAVA